jgi:crotonyl-CoA carboxylase/reductase
MSASEVQIPRGTYLVPRPEQATVADVMHRGVLSCTPDTPMQHVADIMARRRVHAVVVDGIELDAVRGERLAWGVVSDLDLVAAFDGDRLALTAGDIAATPALTVFTGDSLADAARRMAIHEVAHLIVVAEATGRPVGVISTLDVAAAIAWGGTPH